MPRQDRVQLITELEQARNSRVLAMVLGDRPNQETRIAPDAVRLVGRHLRDIGKQANLDLFLYTLGGDVMAGYRVVSLFREYCSAKFSVIVPFRCQSTGTLIALGADEILMLPESQLSPVDPSINGPYNPMIPGMAIQPGAPAPTLPVSVEEVVSYLSLAREVSELKGEESLTTVFERLTQDVRPLALGQVYRARTQIRMLSRKLLQGHMPHEDPSIDSLVETLTEKLYSHDYLISRREAKGIGLKVAEPAPEVEDIITRLYNAYERDLKLVDPFNPMVGLKPGQTVAMKSERAVIETTQKSDTFVTEQQLTLVPQGVQATPVFEGWKST